MIDMTRPVPDATSQSGYKCPSGSKPCDLSFLDSAENAEFAICIPETETEADFCPITSVAFSKESDKYYEASKYDMTNDKATT